MYEGNEGAPRSKAIIKEIVSWIFWLGGALLVALILNNTIIVNAEVVSGSMEKTIMTNDRVLGLRIAYLFGEPERLDVVVFKNPIEKDGDPYVKRIIGLPGETIEIINGKVYIDESDTPLDESSYLYEEMRGSAGPFKVEENCYFMMGDNRNFSKDSREWGLMKREDILGKIYIDFYPGIKLIK